MKKSVFIFLLISTSVFGQTAHSGFNFYLPPYDSIPQRFLPEFPKTPIADNAFISIDHNGHFAVNGNRIRFWGINITDAAAFPEKSCTPGVAAELRKRGFNLVRLHYMDQGNSFSSLLMKGQSTRQLDPVNLDKLEKLVSELKLNGIYADVNLNVVRQFNALDSVPQADSLYEYGKGVTLFDPQLIALQKEYAKELLTHKNPYTGLALRDDPVMGMVEITNENWFFLYWQTNSLRPYKEGGMLTLRHNKMLEEQWNDFLINKYGTTTNLENAWNENNYDLITNGDFENSNAFDNWSLNLNSASDQATVSTETANPYSGSTAAKINVQSTSGTDWHISLNQSGLTFENGRQYTVELYAKASASTTMTVCVGKQTAPYNAYAYQAFQLTDKWTKYSFNYIPWNTKAKDVLLALQVGAGGCGSFWFDSVAIKITPKITLVSGESLENKNIHRMNIDELVNYSRIRVNDLYKFFVSLQENFYTQMYNYLKNDLGVKVPVSGTNWPVGVPDTRIQSEMDYLDNHAYYDPDGIISISMTRNPTTSTVVTSLIGNGVEGKPYTISEYNHPFPNKYQVEVPFFLAGYGAYHDVDAVMLYAMSVGKDWTVDALSYFNCGRNSVLMTCMPSFGYAYRNGLISSANATTVLNYSDDDIYRFFETGGFWMYSNDYDKNLALTHKIRSKFNCATDIDFSTLPATPASPYISDTGQLTWDANGLFSINTDKFIGVVGFPEQMKNASIGNLKIADIDKFAGITWLSIDNQPLAQSKKTLLTLGTNAMNSNMKLSANDSIIYDLGTAPTIVEPTKVTLNMTINADSVRVNSLGTKGETTAGKVYYPDNGHQYTIVLDQYSNHTLWYGIETEWSQEKSLLVADPCLRAEYKVDSTYTIRWYSGYVDKVKIEFSNDGGKTWKPVADNLNAQSCQYLWKVPENESDSCRIKISDMSDASICAISDLFSINSNMFYNGEFLNGTNCWIFNSWGDYNTCFDVVGGQLQSNIRAMCSDFWNPAVVQKNMTFKKGKTYDLTFEASATHNRNMIVEFVGKTEYSNVAFDLTSSLTKYTTNYTMNGATDSTFTVSFDIGGDNANIVFDNMMLKEQKINTGNKYPTENGPGLKINCVPNPFATFATISYSIPETMSDTGMNTNGIPVKIALFNALGVEIKCLLDASQFPGNYTLRLDGSNIPVGIFFCRLQSGNIYKTVKCVLIR
jgi:hypothetical protein